MFTGFMILLLLLIIVLGSYWNSISAESSDTEIITKDDNLFGYDDSNIEIIQTPTIPKRKKSAFIEWDDEEDTHYNHSTYKTQYSDKINVTLNDTDSDYQNPLTTFKVEENSEGIDFLCSCIKRGDLETLMMIMHELSKSGDTGEIYEFLDRKFNLSNLLFNYAH